MSKRKRRSSLGSTKHRKLHLSETEEDIDRNKDSRDFLTERKTDPREMLTRQLRVDRRDDNLVTDYVPAVCSTSSGHTVPTSRYKRKRKLDPRSQDEFASKRRQVRGEERLEPSSRSRVLQASSNSSRNCRQEIVPNWCDMMTRYLKLSAKHVISCESVLNDIHECFVTLIRDINANGIKNKECMILQAIKMLAIICQNLTSDDMPVRDQAEGALSCKFMVLNDSFFAILGYNWSIHALSSLL